MGFFAVEDTQPEQTGGFSDTDLISISKTVSLAGG